MKMRLRIFQALLICSAIGLFVFLGWKEFSPSGVLRLSKNVDDISPFFSRVLPDDRTEEFYLDESGKAYQPIVGEPAYFTLTPPTNFDLVDIEFKFKNNASPIIELGLLMNTETDSYALLPLQNKILDELDWCELHENGIALYDRNCVYDSIADFLVDTPESKEIATYHYQIERPYKIAGYVPSLSYKTLNISLRGEHEFVTYVQNEPLNFIFKFMDMNRTLGADTLEVLVFDTNGNVVASKFAEDDGNESADGVGSSMKSISISERLQNGVYKIILKTNRDVFFREIETTQSKMVFVNQIFIGDEVGYSPYPNPTSFVTDAKNMNFETQHAEGVQSVDVDGASVLVEEPFVQERHNVRSAGISTVIVPKGDLLIRGAGHYAFSREMYFNPDPARLEWNTDLDALGINYVITNYNEPIVDGDVVTANARFDLTRAPQVKDAWKFVISIPGIYDHLGSVDLSEVSAILRREPLSFSIVMDKIFGKIENILQR